MLSSLLSVAVDINILGSRCVTNMRNKELKTGCDALSSELGEFHNSKIKVVANPPFSRPTRSCNTLYIDSKQYNKVGDMKRWTPFTLMGPLYTAALEFA